MTERLTSTLNKFKWSEVQDFNPGMSNVDFSPERMQISVVTPVSSGTNDEDGLYESTEFQRVSTDIYGRLEFTSRQYGHGGGVWTGGGSFKLIVNFADGSSARKRFSGSITDSESEAAEKTQTIDLPSGKQIDSVQVEAGAYGNVTTYGELFDLSLIKTGSEESDDSGSGDSSGESNPSGSNMKRAALAGAALLLGVILWQMS